MSSSGRPVLLPPHERPRLMVLIDVEEEFDWEAPFERQNTGAQAVTELGLGLDTLSELGVVPVGVMSYPVVANETSASILREFVTSGRLQPGAHLHPWVCPPFEEVVSGPLSFPGNLPPELEERKLRELGAAIEAAVGVAPRVYQAGRYGIGRNSYALLEKAGYLVDMSCSPPFDYRSEGGPDFSAARCGPSWVRRELLEIPVTGAFVGFLGEGSATAFRLATRPLLSALRLPGVLARLRAAERLRLSPEGHGLADMQRLTRALLARGERVFTLSFHSPSLAPGYTSYVRTPAQRDEFVARLRAYIEWFQAELDGRATTPLELHAQLTEDP